MPRTKRDTQTYALYQGRKKVYIGSSSDPVTRAGEHKSEGKRFTRMEVTSVRMSADSAKQREGEQIGTYKRSHGGRTPKYNKTDYG